MKTLDEIQKDLEVEGFEITGGEEKGKRYKVREFSRKEGQSSLAIIRVFVYNQGDEENEEGVEEGEEVELSPQEIDYAVARLVSKCPDEIIRLIESGNVAVPKWLRKEILERRKVKNEQVR